jgi:hypothetical protein
VLNEDEHGSVHRTVSLILKAILLVGFVLSLVQGRFLHAVTTLGIIIVTLLPVVLSRRFDVRIPPEIEVLAVIFVYAALFLGEVQDFYTRYWWWDVVLHGSAGFLLGILGLLLVHVLNETEHVEFYMRPRFVALFAFMFAVGMGALWEIFEFGMDQIFGLNMQKSGLEDTMWDLIVDTGGALLVSLMGLGYLHTKGSDSFIERWIEAFIRANPRLFRRGRRRT